MVEYVTLNAAAARQVFEHWAGRINPGTVIVAGAALLLVWLVWRAFVKRA